MPLVPNLESKS